MKLVINAIMTRPGGALTVLVGLLKAWRAAQPAFEVSILASVPETLKQLQQADFGVTIEPIVVGASPLRRTVWQATRLGAWIKRHRADVVLTNNHFLERMPCPQIVHHHNLWRFVTVGGEIRMSRGVSNRLRDWSARRALTCAEANVFVSEFLRAQAEQIEPASRARNHVIPNCVDDELVRRAPGDAVDANSQRTTRASKPSATLLAVQSANEHKDNPTLISTLAELSRLEPTIDWQLQIAGSAGRAAWQPVQALAARLGVRDRVQWLGFLEMDELRRLEQQALCVLATSRVESSGLTVIEAMAADCPVVASRIPAFEEYACRTAELVTPGDAQGFAKAVCQLYHSPARRAEMIERGRGRVSEYRWSNWAPRLAQLVAEIAQDS